MNSKGNYKVYAHIAPNKKIYIGITKMKVEHRWLSNGGGYKNCKLFWRAIQKHGWDNFDHIVLLDGLSKDVACECEKFLIKKYKSNDAEHGYNCSEGGSSGSAGYTMSDETKKRISEKLKGHRVSDETRRKIGEANSKALKGRKVPQEVIEKTKAHPNGYKGFKGRKHTEEAKRKNAEAHIGKKYHLGYKHSDEAKEKMRLAKLGKKRGPWTEEERKAHMAYFERRRKEKQKASNS